MRDNNSIRVSRSLRDTAYKAIYAKENYVKKNLKEPTINEIASEIGISKEDIVYAMDAIQTGSFPCKLCSSIRPSPVITKSISFMLSSICK